MEQTENWYYIIQRAQPGARPYNSPYIWFLNYPTANSPPFISLIFQLVSFALVVIWFTLLFIVDLLYTLYYLYNKMQLFLF